MTYEFTSRISSPGLGVTPVKLSKEPLATEGEATRGADEQVDYDEIHQATFGVVKAPDMFEGLEGGPDVDMDELYW